MENHLGKLSSTNHLNLIKDYKNVKKIFIQTLNFYPKFKFLSKF